MQLNYENTTHVTKTKTQLQPDKSLKLKLKCRFSNIKNYK